MSLCEVCLSYEWSESKMRLGLLASQRRCLTTCRIGRFIVLFTFDAHSSPYLLWPTVQDIAV